MAVISGEVDATPALTPAGRAAGVVAAIGLIGALLVGEPVIAAIAAPFAVLAMIGATSFAPTLVAASWGWADDRVIEGEEVAGAVQVRGPRGAGALEVGLPVIGAGIEQTVAWRRPATAAGSDLVRVHPDRWGRVVGGPLVVRGFGPLHLTTWTAVLPGTAEVRVLPSPPAIRALLPPTSPRTSAGLHPSRVRGDGWDFAGLRPYRPGDRLSRLSRAASARHGQPWVTDRHLERSADLVLLVDAFAAHRTGSPDADDPTLLDAVRAAWAVTELHLRAQDRVGVIRLGGTVDWLTPSGGDRARYQLLDHLLAARSGHSDAERSLRHVPRRALPAGAHVLVLSPLHDQRIVNVALDLRRRGLATAVLRLAGPAPAGHTPLDDLALRLWALELDRRAAVLAEHGITVVPGGSSADERAVALRELARPRRHR